MYRATFHSLPPIYSTWGIGEIPGREILITFGPKPEVRREPFLAFPDLNSTTAELSTPSCHHEPRIGHARKPLPSQLHLQIRCMGLLPHGGS